MNKHILYITEAAEEHFFEEFHASYSIMTNKKYELEIIRPFLKESFCIIIDATINYKRALKIVTEIIQENHTAQLIIVGTTLKDLEDFRSLGITNLYVKDDRCAITTKVDELFSVYMNEYERNILFQLATEPLKNFDPREAIELLKKRIIDYLPFSIATLLIREKTQVKTNVILRGHLKEKDIKAYLERILSSYQNLLQKEYRFEDLLITTSEVSSKERNDLAKEKLTYLTLPILASDDLPYGLVELASGKKFEKHDVRFFYAIIQEVSRNLEYVLRIKKLMDEKIHLENSDASKNTLLHMCAQELQTPLSLAETHLDTLKKALSLQSREAENFTHIEKTMKHLQTVSTHLLKAAQRVQSLEQPQALIKIEKLIHEVISYFEPELNKKSITVIPKIESNLSLFGHYDDFMRIFISLFDQNIRNQEPHSSIEMHVELTDAKELKLENIQEIFKNKAYFLRNSFICFTIKTEKQNKTFDRFSYDSFFPELSLLSHSLSIPREIIEAYGGNFFTNHNGQHSIHTFYLPLDGRPYDIHKIYETLNELKNKQMKNKRFSFTAITVAARNELLAPSDEPLENSISKTKKNIQTFLEPGEEVLRLDTTKFIIFRQNKKPYENRKLIRNLQKELTNPLSDQYTIAIEESNLV